jgi:hypothetical protein
MTGPLRFKAQALDNASPDEYQAGGAMLLEHDRSGRLSVTEEISTISRLGKVHLKQNGAELILHGRRFLAQVVSEQRDVAGRRAAILCCGELDGRSDPAAEAAALVAGLMEFAAATGRSIEPMHLEAVRVAVANRAGARVSRGFLIGLAVIAAATAAGVAVSVRHAEPPGAHGQTR